MNGRTGITAEITVREVLWAYPETRVVFDKYGMMGCGGAEGPPEPVSFFAQMHGLSTAELMSELNAAILSGPRAAGGTPPSAECSSCASSGHADVLTPKSTFRASRLHSDDSDPCPCGPGTDTSEESTISPQAARLLSAPSMAPEPRAEGSKCTHGESAKELARIFIRTALAMFLAFGGLTGLIALLSITSPRISFPEVLTWPALVQSHAHAQVFGFAAMFVLGISYHVMPRFMGVPLRNVGAAWASYGLLLGGVILRCLYQPFAQNPAAGVTAFLGSTLEVGAVVAFLSVIRATLREHKKILPAGRSGQPFVHIKYLIVGSLSLFVAAILSGDGAWLMLARETNVQPAALNAVWINLSLLGFVGMFIFGVGQRTMPHFLGLERLRPAAGKAALGLLSAGIVLQIGSVLFPGEKMQIAVSAVLELSGFTLFLIAVPLLGRLPVHRPAAPPYFASFVRSAFVWGWIGTAGYAAVAVLDVLGVAVPRTIVDAYRHAWTLGWITMLIVGVGYRIIPIFFGREINRPAVIPFVFWSLTAAVLIRVCADVLCLWVPAAYPWMNLSGLLALLAVGLFAGEVWNLTSSEVPAESAESKMAITENSNVASVLESYPEVLPVFVRHGFGALQNPVARKTVARFVTIGQAARKHGVEEAIFISELKKALNQTA